LTAEIPMPIIKEHTYGCSINTPHCAKCGKYCDAIQHKAQSLVTGGYLFYSLAFLCTRCHEWIKTPQAELDILNKFSQTREDWERRVLKPPIGKQPHTDAPFGEASSFYPQ